MATKKYCLVALRVSPAEFERFQKLKDNGYSVRETFEIISEKCSSYPITIFSKKNGEPLMIPQNILSKKRR
jgi:hypothetical protein